MGVVIQACRVHFGSANTEALQSLLQVTEEDWISIVKLARQHRIRPRSQSLTIMYSPCQYPKDN